MPRRRKIKNRHVNLIQTGGTIGMKRSEDGTLSINSETQGTILEYLQRVPFVEYIPIESPMQGDSSEHTKKQIVELGQRVLEMSNERDASIIAYGTDTMNFAAATLALMGNEVYKTPVVFLGAIKDPLKLNSDAPKNAITAGLFAAYGNGSGVFAVRPGGIIITSRHDTPGGSINWHGRGIPQAPDAYFAKINLERLLDDEDNFSEEIKQIISIRKKRESPIQKFLEIFENNDIIDYKRNRSDGTLDLPDQLVVGGRGWLPPLQILGLRKGSMLRFKDRPWEDNTHILERDAKRIVEDRINKGYAKSEVIPYLAIIETIKRHHRKHDVFNKWWKDIFGMGLVNLNMGYNYDFINFWERYSDTCNDEMDFSDIISIKIGNSDPEYLYRAFQKTPPKALILQATGSAGVRIRYPDESFSNLLTYCKESEIPVVLTSSSRGEVTSFEYGPALQALDEDLVFFSGTMDPDLVEPRLALLNHASNRNFIYGLVDKLEVNSSEKKAIRRNIYRQLLSGTHYKNLENGGTTDRQRIMNKHNIETIVDLMSGVHVKKAILSAYLHEIYQKEIEFPYNSSAKLLRD